MKVSWMSCVLKSSRVNVLAVEPWARLTVMVNIRIHKIRFVAVGFGVVIGAKQILGAVLLFVFGCHKSSQVIALLPVY